MINNIKYISVILLIFTTFLFSSENINLTVKEKDWIKNNTVSMGIEQWEPLIYVNEQNEVEGIVGEIINLIIKRLDLKVRVIPNKWDILLESFKKGDIDLLPATYYTKQRATYGLYSKDYFKIKEYIYLKNNNNTINNFEDLKGKKIAIIKDYGTIPKIKKRYPTIHIIQTNDMAQSVKFVLEGKVDALIDAQIRVEHFIYKNIIVGLKGISQDSFTASPLYFFSNIKKPILQSILQKGLKTITPNEYKNIVNKWLNIENSDSTRSDLILTKQEIKYLKDKKVLKVCVDPSWMPFDAIIDNKHTGLANDYIRLISKKIDTPIKLVITKTWNETLLKARGRKCDIISIISITEDRLKYLDFTQEFIDVPIVIATKDTNLFIENILQIIDKKIAIVKGYSIGTYLKKRYPNIKIVEVTSITKGLEAVEKNKVFAYIDNLASINYEIQKNFNGTIRVSGRLEKRIKYRSATRKDEKILNTIIRKTINSIDNSTRKDIFNRWSTLTIETKIDYTFMWQLLGTILLFTLLSIYRQFELSKYNKKLEEEVKLAVEKTKQQNKLLYMNSKRTQMGEMIGMIAHQWRQPLTAISSKSSALITKTKLGKLDDKKTIQIATQIIKYTEHLSQTIDDFRNFFKSNNKTEPISLDEMVDSILNIVKSTNNINLTLNLNSKDIFYTYKNELKQVILNFIQNAEDILKENKINNPYIEVTTYTKENRYILEVKDNGGGVPDAIIDKIFNPYFSTKTKKDGTGLGLYMSKTIIEEHCKGELTIHNHKKGAIFKIILEDIEND